MAALALRGASAPRRQRSAALALSGGSFRRRLTAAAAHGGGGSRRRRLAVAAACRGGGLPWRRLAVAAAPSGLAAERRAGRAGLARGCDRAFGSPAGCGFRSSAVLLTAAAASRGLLLSGVALGEGGFGLPTQSGLRRLRCRIGVAHWHRCRRGTRLAAATTFVLASGCWSAVVGLAGGCRCAVRGGRAGERPAVVGRWSGRRPAAVRLASCCRAAVVPLGGGACPERGDWPFGGGAGG
jgi:hypothetical protein